jgi:protein SCO1/2
MAATLAKGSWLSANVGPYKFCQLAALLSLLLTGCGEKPSPPVSATAATNSAQRSFETRGVVRSVPEAGRTLVVRHDEIPDYMPKMTMELNVRDTNALRGLQRDDEITFRLVATADTHWIENIQKVGRAAPSDPSPKPTVQAIVELKPGDELPDAAMVTEDGQPLRFSHFRGQAVAFTFFFTRCPLPDFCPRMGANFAQARALLLTRAQAPTNWHFISLSFDPEYDRPEVLTGAALAHRNVNHDRWLYAAATPELLTTLGPRLDFMFSREGGSFSHNLRTVVLDPQGRIYKQFDGNLWTPLQLADAVAAAANLPPGK